MKRPMMMGAAILVLVAAAGCDKDESFVTADQVEATVSGAVNQAAPKCTPGLVQDCPCPMGALGVQTCADDGKRWGACADCWNALPPSSGGGQTLKITCDPMQPIATVLYPGKTAEELFAVRAIRHTQEPVPFHQTIASMADGKVIASCDGDYTLFIGP